MLYSIAGLTLGVIVNKAFKLLFNKTSLLSVFLQIFTLICIVYILHRYVNMQFVDDFQGYVGGLFFVGFFFGTQTKIYNYYM